MSKLAYMEWVEQTYHCWNPQVYEQEAVLECLESKNIWVRGLLLSVWAIFGLTLGKISKWGRFRTQIPANVFDHCWARKGENNLQDTIKVNSVKEACAKCFVVHILKFETLQITWKNQTKNIRPLVLSFSTIDLAFWCILSCLFMWFARFQILISEPQSIWCKLLVLSWLYRGSSPNMQISSLQIL